MLIRSARPETLSDVEQAEQIGLDELPMVPIHAIGGLVVLLGLAILVLILAMALPFAGGHAGPVFVPPAIPTPPAGTLGR